eukprot:scaffold42007_cov75-Phaeocystis_antarctica.AAC.5
MVSLPSNSSTTLAEAASAVKRTAAHGPTGKRLLPPGSVNSISCRSSLAVAPYGPMVGHVATRVPRRRRAAATTNELFTTWASGHCAGRLSAEQRRLPPPPARPVAQAQRSSSRQLRSTASGRWRPAQPACLTIMEAAAGSRQALFVRPARHEAAPPTSWKNNL